VNIKKKKEKKVIGRLLLWSNRGKEREKESSPKTPQRKRERKKYRKHLINENL